ncbi:MULTISPECIES: NAD(P)-dependent oxidoreductase [unclassified Rhizobium]|uniref:NAD(P)-dependent oxidoreductase n=1 Tax=unclassified Rhizobium TaxID=2613769 RepID=UPI002180BF7F|nr:MULTISPECIES: NAD(P)H-binding protein [unclassified Rhizobium]
MTCVAILGGSGRLGSRIVANLIRQKMQVRALVHSHGLAAAESDYTAVYGDAHDPSAIRALLTGADAVISTLGSAGAQIADVTSAAVRNLIPEMTALEITRIVSVTGSAVRDDIEVGREHPHMAERRAALMQHIPGLVLDGEGHLRLLRQSTLNWTVIRLPRMTSDPARPATLRVDPPVPAETISYEAGAEAIVEELIYARWVRKAPFASEA